MACPQVVTGTEFLMRTLAHQEFVAARLRRRNRCFNHQAERPARDRVGRRDVFNAFARVDLVSLFVTLILARRNHLTLERGGDLAANRIAITEQESVIRPQ